MAREASGRSVRSPRERSDIRHLLKRDDGSTLLVDSDVWLCALDLAARRGWQPSGLEEPDSLAWNLASRRGRSRRWDRLGYLEPHGQRIDALDAASLSTSLSSALPVVPDQEVPLQGKAFGDEEVLDLIRKAHEGEDIPADELPAAAEILSGPPKEEAVALADFLSGGGVTLNRFDRGGRSWA